MEMMYTIKYQKILMDKRSSHSPRPQWRKNKQKTKLIKG